ncbi:MAG TPA: 16S rRNA (guanine(527)-N(7))-methyltransferase RsmG [Gammaproteobacteria bacterium]
MRDWRENLHDELRNLGAPEAAGILTRYVELLQRWNQAFNLTAIRDPAEMVPRHILDSAVIAPFVKAGSVADAGTGAGLPGIVLAVLRPELAITLIDSNGKKTRFCKQAVSELGLRNVAVTQARIEGYRPMERFATVVSRAYASLAEFIASTRHLLDDGGTFLAMKGAYPHEEIRALPAGVRVVAVHPLRVPGLDAERHIVEMELSAGGGK